MRSLGLRYTVAAVTFAIGQGRIFACLHENKSSLSAGCGEVIDHVELPKE